MQITELFCWDFPADRRICNFSVRVGEESSTRQLRLSPLSLEDRKPAISLQLENLNKFDVITYRWCKYQEGEFSPIENFNVAGLFEQQQTIPTVSSSRSKIFRTANCSIACLVGCTTHATTCIVTVCHWKNHLVVMVQSAELFLFIASYLRTLKYRF